MALVPNVPGLVVRPVENSTDMHAVRRLHAECYVATGYVNTSDLDTDGYIQDPWIPFSDYYAAVDSAAADQIVGTCRIIRPSVRGFPAFQECATLPDALDVFATLDPGRCVEISALATPRIGMQNMAISAALYGLVWQEAITQGRAYMLAVMDDRLLRIMRRWFEFPFETIGEPCQYMGSPSTPVSMYLPRTIEILTASNPDALRFFSGDIPFDELNDYALDVRTEVPEHRSNVIDLRRSRTAI
jgi:N-acyl amino acid synthase FeeM